MKGLRMCENVGSLAAHVDDLAFQLIIFAIALLATVAGMVITALWVHQQQNYIETLRDHAEHLAVRAWQQFMPRAEP